MSAQPDHRASLEQLQRQLLDPSCTGERATRVAAELSELGRDVTAALEAAHTELADRNEPNAA